MSTDSKDIIPSKTFCVYPWTHSYQGCQYERKLCCVSKDVYGHDKMETKDFWNSDYMQTVRKKMLKGEKVSECDVCYKNEDLGIKSLREESSFDVVRAIKAGKSTMKDILSDTTTENGVLDTKPNYYDYRTIHCNLQCVSCGSVYSSTHINLNEEMWGPQKNRFTPDYAYENKMGIEMIEGLNEKRIKNIYWAGGEPMMQPLHWLIINHMTKLLTTPGYEDYIKTVRMHYNTNLTKNKWKKQHIPDILEPFQPSIQASLDGVCETIEYTRDGAKWKDVKQHWHEYFTILNKREQMGLATVLSAPVLFDIDRYLEFYGPYDPYLHPHYMFTVLDKVMQNPGFLDIRWYPKDIFYGAIDKVKSALKGSELRGSPKWISVLEAYEKEYKGFQNNLPTGKEKDLEILKGLQLYREQFLVTKRTLDELYDITNPQAAEWIRSIKPAFTNPDMEVRLRDEFGIDF